MPPDVVAHCDWSIDPKKRWMGVALLRGRSWCLGAPELVGATENLVQQLMNRGATRKRLLLGFDFPIGLPIAYAERTGLDDFRQALTAFGSGDWAQWFEVAQKPGEISIRRPFYPDRPGKAGENKLNHLLDAMDLPNRSSLLRVCETGSKHRRAACSLFWTLGGNQVGKAAIAGWREVVRPALANRHVAFWPFDGSLSDLFGDFDIVLAEAYPADVYERLGIARKGWSKRDQAARRRVAHLLLKWANPQRAQFTDELVHAIRDGFGASRSGEDRFDAVVGLIGMIDVASGNRSDGAPDDPDIRNWEGWILGHNR